jgi:predicted Fe-Mo cluster-binding NifX family protein
MYGEGPKGETMKIAVACQDGKQISDNLYTTDTYRLYKVENGYPIYQGEVRTRSVDYEALGRLLSGLDVETLLCGGISKTASILLAESVIMVYPGLQGDADAQIQAFLDGELIYHPRND